MLETKDEIDRLQDLLDTSHRGASDHLRGIINERRTLRATDVVALMTGMKVLTVATVTAGGEARISALDGHFLHGHWVFGTSRTSAKARHIARRPGVSAAHVDGEEVALFTHGRAFAMAETDQDYDETLAHLTAHYGSSPLSWGDTAIYRIESTWMVGYAFDRDRLLHDRGLI